MAGNPLHEVGVERYNQSQQTGANSTPQAPVASNTLSAWTTPWKQEEMKYNEDLLYKQWAREDQVRKAQEQWENTAVQRKIKDIKEAGLNPYLAVMGNAAGAGVPTQSTSAGRPEMKSDTGALITGVMTLIGALLFAGTGLGKAKMTKSAGTLTKTYNSKGKLSSIVKKYNM